MSNWVLSGAIKLQTGLKQISTVLALGLIFFAISIYGSALRSLGLLSIKLGPSKKSKSYWLKSEPSRFENQY